MRAVWSFWSKPFMAHRAGFWRSEKHHLLSWILSLHTAKKHYPETSLWTDNEGVRLLIDGIELEFDNVSTDLNELNGTDPDWWMLGKLYTYSVQTQPFVHIDSDAYLWKRLPARLETAPVFAQNPETFSYRSSSWYRPHLYDAAIVSSRGWAPPEWSWYTARRGSTAVCCGILGGNRLDFLRHYANQAIKFLRHPNNQTCWQHLNKIRDNVLFEQYLLAACIEYHRCTATSPYADIEISYLFDSLERTFDTAAAKEMGYTHLIGNVKANPTIADRLEQRVARDCPAQYERVIKYLQGWSEVRRI